jgi:predicted dehydrogenase
LATYGPTLDAAFIITPHVYHRVQAEACLDAGLDVLLEKPMVMSGGEARSLIEATSRTGRLLVVGFDGSLSPEIRTAAALLRSGTLGEILTVSATVWQNWDVLSAGTWRQVPSLSGGGFLFDTGAHMLNTVADLAGEPFIEVAAWLDNRGRAVDITGVVMARLASGGLVTFNACGDTAPSCTSDVLVFCTRGILRTGVWGRVLEVQGPDDETLAPVDVPASLGVWEQFLAVRAGLIPNPSPPQVGLRMAALWDAIQASAKQGGRPVPTKLDPVGEA